MLYPILNRNSSIPIKTGLNIFQLYIRPILTYAAVSWASYICSNKGQKLESIQLLA